MCSFSRQNSLSCFCVAGLPLLRTTPIFQFDLSVFLVPHLLLDIRDCLVWTWYRCVSHWVALGIDGWYPLAFRVILELVGPWFMWACTCWVTVGHRFVIHRIICVPTLKCVCVCVCIGQAIGHLQLSSTNLPNLSPDSR